MAGESLERNLVPIFLYILGRTRWRRPDPRRDMSSAEDAWVTGKLGLDPTSMLQRVVVECMIRAGDRSTYFPGTEY